MSQKIVIGTRGSALALVQTEIAKKMLQTARPEISIEVRIIKTEGDVNQNPIPLDTVGKGWFTKEIERALADGTIDMAVHSLKDLPEELPQDLVLSAYLEREDPRDVLVTKDGRKIDALKVGAIIGTDSIRRGVQIHALRNDLKVQSIRGNVPTRLEKLMSEDYDAIVIAAAGLKRLGLEDRITSYFEPDQITPAPGQGILAVEARKKDAVIMSLLTEVNDADAALAAALERAFSKAVGGGCKEPVGAYVYREAEDVMLLGMIAEEDGSKIVRDRIKATDKDAAQELASRLLSALKN